MYESFYGFRERPFDLTPNPRFLVMTDVHREALSNLEYGIASRTGITLLVGDAGTGKTTLIRTALERQPSRVHCVHLQNPALTRNEFVEMLACRFELSDRARESKTALLLELEEVLKKRAEAGESTVLLIDEAQSLPREILEEIRLLANIETNERKLLSVIMAGQPEVTSLLNDESLRQLKQRVALRCELRPLTLQETAGYIAGRIRSAGGVGAQVFTREAVTLIHERSRGIPRTISVIADNALLTGFAVGQRPVNSSTVREVCRDFDLRRTRRTGSGSGATGRRRATGTGSRGRAARATGIGRAGRRVCSACRGAARRDRPSVRRRAARALRHDAPRAETRYVFVLERIRAAQMSRIDEAMRRATGVTGGAVEPTPAETVEDLQSEGTSEAEALSREPFPLEMPDRRPRPPGPSSAADQPGARPSYDTSAGTETAAAAESTLFERLDARLTEKIVVDHNMSPASREQYRRLAAVLHDAHSTAGLRTVMVASAVAGEGKTLTASNLALTFSESYQKRVLLIDADLRRPSLHTVFRLDTALGLGDGLMSGSEAKMLVRQVSPRLAVLPAGRPSSDPMAGLTSERMRRLLDEAKQAFDWVILDTPPVMLLPDAHLLASMVEGAVLVVRAGSTPHDLVKRSADAIGRAKILGVVLNCAEASGAHDDHYQYYGYSERGGTDITRL